MLAAVLLLVSQSVVAQTAATGTISGRVTDRQTGQPIAQAVLQLMTDAGQSAAVARTDAVGRYALTGLAAGRYRLIAIPPPFRATHVSTTFSRSGSNILTLRAGDTQTDIDIALARSFAIGGRVVDDRGVPAARVRIVARRVDNRQTQGGWSRTTDDLGRFRLFGLEAGRYVVCAEIEGQGTLSTASTIESLVTTCYPDVRAEAEAVPVTTGGDEPAEIELRLARNRTFTVAGVVLDSSGRPVDRPTVELTTLSRHGSTTSPMSGERDGRFTIRGLNPGQYILDVRPRGAFSSDSPPPQEGATRPVTIGADDVEGLVLTLSPLASVSGHVVFEGATSFRRPPGPPILITARLDGLLWRIDGGAVGTVTDGGTFELTGLVGRRHLAVLNAPTGWYVKRITYRGKDITDVPTEFATSADPLGLEVLFSDRGAAVSGRVLDDGGLPVRARVMMIPADRERWPAFQRPLATTSAAGGGYEFRDLRDGDYAIAALDPADPALQLDDASLFARLIDAGQRFTLVEGERRALDLRVLRLAKDR